jgi:hypothetical protein
VDAFVAAEYLPHMTASRDRMLAVMLRGLPVLSDIAGRPSRFGDEQSSRP